MDRVTFMRELEQLFSKLPPKERRAALSIFENEFDMAGPEGEADVIRRLGSPRQAAGQIMYIEDEAPEDHEAGGDHTKTADQAQDQMPAERQTMRERKPDRRTTLTLAFIAAVFCLLVIAIARVGVRPLGLGILTVLAALTLGPCIGAAALSFVGYRLVVHGAILLASRGTDSFLTAGCGFLCMAAGMLLFILFIVVDFWLLPILGRSAGILLRNLGETVRRLRERGGRA